MQRILDPAQIEAFGQASQASIPRLRLADSAQLFEKRAARLRHLSERHAIGEYLALMAALCEAQQQALLALAQAPADSAEPSARARERLAQAREHGMPLLPASGWPRDSRWRRALAELCGRIRALSGIPAGVSALCARLTAAGGAQLEEQADQLLARDATVDMETAPFLMAALQVYWVHLATTLVAEDAGGVDAGRGHDLAAYAQGLCPVCGTVPVASIVRADGQHQGYRYLHCGLCASEWHLVRIKCSHCLATEGIRYHFVAGGSDAVRAESCQSCRMYRKILYQEKDTSAEPLADDLASLALDLLMSAEGYRRAACNPLLWQTNTG
jgi:FdhE protein